jgi:para-aminobenzoate synthetase component 1
MWVEDSFVIDSPSRFHQKALQWAQQFDEICLFNSHGIDDEWSNFDVCLAVKAQTTFLSDDVDTFSKIQRFVNLHADAPIIPGFFSYDLKNEIEDLESRHVDHLGFPQAFFFIPEIVIEIKGNSVYITAPQPSLIFNQIQDTSFSVTTPSVFKGQIKQRWSKDAYLKAFTRMQHHIQQGDIYEVNLCQEFYAENVIIDPLHVYQRLSQVSPTPFSCFFKIKEKYILCASPERFLAKRKELLISQPIKGTAKRGATAAEDQVQITSLLDSKKEIAENVMIVDLVRNDLTRSAIKGTVKADRLFEIQTFQQVHQMVSTITCQKHEQTTDLQAIKNTFPAGSMTGAPKIAAMKLCDEIESARRGIYAGSIGYFAGPDCFDFNVVIRTLLYNSSNSYLSFHTGGAITSQAIGEQEYAECLLKAKGILQALDTTLS